MYINNLFIPNNLALPQLSFIPPNFYLNPILDEKSLEEIYNVGDYSPLDYTYDNYDDITKNELNRSSFIENITKEINFTTQMLEQNDTSDVIFTTFKNLTDTTDLSEEINTTSTTGNFFNESIVSNETTEEKDYNTSTSADTILSTITVDLNETSSLKAEDFTMSSSTEESNNTSDEYLITTFNTNSKSSDIATELTEEPNTETTDKISTIDHYGGVIPLVEKDYDVKCFEQICNTTTQDTSMNKVQFVYYIYKNIMVSSVTCTF